MVAVQEKAALCQGTVLWPFRHVEYAHSGEGFQEGSRIICDRFEIMEVDSSTNKIEKNHALLCSLDPDEISNSCWVAQVQ